MFRVDWGGGFRMRVVGDSEYEQSGTREHDEKAVRVLAWIAVPLFIGCSAYSFIYEQHKSWYSWILASLVGFVYSFGNALLVNCMQLCRLHHDDTATVY